MIQFLYRMEDSQKAIAAMIAVIVAVQVQEEVQEALAFAAKSYDFCVFDQTLRHFPSVTPSVGLPEAFEC